MSFSEEKKIKQVAQTWKKKKLLQTRLKLVFNI